MPKILQKGICSVLVVALSLACSVQAFAAGYAPQYVEFSTLYSNDRCAWSLLEPLLDYDNGYSVKVQLSNATAEQQALWTECMEGVAAGEWVLAVESSGFSGLSFCFFPCKEVSQQSASPYEPGYFYYSSGSNKGSFGCYANVFTFSFLNSSYVPLNEDCSGSFNRFVCTSLSFGASTSPNGTFCSDLPFVLDKANNSFPTYRYFLTGLDTLQVTDDLGNSSVKPEPEPDPAPEPDPRPPYVPEMPTIPAGNSEYVPYDTSIWWTFIEHIGRNAGGSSTMGMYILFAIIAVPLVLRVIKKFFHI